MQHYKAPDNALHCIEPEFAHMLPEGCVEVSDTEAAAIRAVQNQPTPQQLEAQLTTSIQLRLDDFARTRGYDDMKILVTYAGDTDPQFDKEGTYGKKARSDTWVASRAILDQVQAGTRPMPTSIADIEADLPALVWPV